MLLTEIREMKAEGKLMHDKWLGALDWTLSLGRQHSVFSPNLALMVCQGAEVWGMLVHPVCPDATQAANEGMRQEARGWDQRK
jgi:hypothetical protein